MPHALPPFLLPTTGGLRAPVEGSTARALAVTDNPGGPRGWVTVAGQRVPFVTTDAPETVLLIRNRPAGLSLGPQGGIAIVWHGERFPLLVTPAVGAPVVLSFPGYQLEYRVTRVQSVASTAVPAVLSRVTGDNLALVLATGPTWRSRQVILAAPAPRR